jgi:flagellar protein FliO/FliZ
MIPKESLLPRTNTDRLRLACLAIAVAVAVFVPIGRAHAAQDSGVTAPGGTSLPSSIPVKRDGAQETAGADGDRWWLAITAAGGLLAFAVIAARRRTTTSVNLPARPLWARFGGLLDSATSHEIQRVSSTRLSSRHSLHVVVWNGRRLLLGCTDQSIQLLAEASSWKDEGGTPSAAGSSAVPDVRS